MLVGEVLGLPDEKLVNIHIHLKGIFYQQDSIDWLCVWSCLLNDIGRKWKNIITIIYLGIFLQFKILLYTLAKKNILTSITTFLKEVADNKDDWH